jgi:hypothetical protein
MPGETNDRFCGGCTACCKTHAVFEINKPRAEWCPDCSVGQGCRIYFMRPISCQQFRCAWLTGVGVTKPEHRPDKTNIVPDYKVIPGLGMALWLWEAEAGALASHFTVIWTHRNLMVGNAVLHLPLTNHPSSICPEDLFFLGSWHSGRINK